MTNLTYARLEEVLLALGFARGALVQRNKVFRHEATGALVIYPDLPASDPVLPRHLRMVESVLENYGIAGAPDLAAVFPKAG